MDIVLEIKRTAAWFFLLTVIFLPLEYFFPARPKSGWHREKRTDVIWFFFNGLLTPALFSMVSAILAVTISRFITPPDIDLPLWERMAATLLVGEFGYYWGHRLSHEIPFLWRFHAMHHTAKEVDWLTTTRGHPVDIVFTRLCGFVPLYLLGLARPGGTYGNSVLLLIILTMIWGFFIHANLKWRLGWLEQIIATPAFHRWHHTADEHLDHNYAPTLPFYDRMFGTLYLPKRGSPPRFGVDGAPPQGFLSQALDPLLPWIKPLGDAPVTTATPKAATES